MTDDFIKKALNEAFKVYTTLLEDREQKANELAQVDERIAKVKPKIVGLAALTDDIPEDSPLGQFLIETTGMGITDAVRDAIKANGEWMTPVQIRDALVKIGYDLTSKYVNPVAILHNILKRLKDSGELEQRTNEEGKTEYRRRLPRHYTLRERTLVEAEEKDIEAAKARRERPRLTPPVVGGFSVPLPRGARLEAPRPLTPEEKEKGKK